MSIPLPVVFLGKDSKIVRCRTVSVGKEKFVQNRIHCTYAEFANPKRKKFLKIGRANTEETSVFYGSVETKAINGFQTATFELLPTTYNEKKEFRNSDFTRLDLVAGIWIIQRNIPLVILGSLGEDYVNLNELGHRRIKMMKDYLDDNKNGSDIIRIVDEFLGSEFSKDVKKGEEYNYKISANYVDLLHKTSNFKGVIYPSTKALGAGNNIVIFSKFVRNKYLKLVHGVYSIYYDRENSCVNEYPMKGDYSNGKIRWVDYPNGLIPPMMKKYYLGQSDDNNFMKYIPMVELDKPLNENT